MTEGPILDPLRERLKDKTVRSESGTPLLLLILVIVSLVLSLVVGLFLVQLDRSVKRQNEELEIQVAALTAAIEKIEQDAQVKVEESLQQMRSNLDSTREQVVDLTQTELARTRRQTETLQQRQRAVEETLSQQIDTKADAQQLEELATQSGQMFEQLGSKINVVQEDVEASRSELEKTIAELSNLGLQVTEQGKLIAVNEEGMGELRRRGERDYFEFSLDKNRRLSIAGIGVELRKTNQKNQHADLNLFVDDRRMEQKKIYTNSPLNFYVGPDRIAYELIINSVDKNLVRGYISVPTGSVPESPELRRRQSSP